MPHGVMDAYKGDPNSPVMKATLPADTRQIADNSHADLTLPALGVAIAVGIALLQRLPAILRNRAGLALMAAAAAMILLDLRDPPALYHWRAWHGLHSAGWPTIAAIALGMLGFYHVIASRPRNKI